jgi:drug/metabolite transporter (DMT)-like permease
VVPDTYHEHKCLCYTLATDDGLAAIVLGGAAPVFFANSGLLFAPVAHAGALFPGVMPLMVALLAAALLREEFTSTKKLVSPLSCLACLP